MARYSAPVLYSDVGEIAPAGVATEALANSARSEVFRPLCRQFNATGEGTTFNIPHTRRLRLVLSQRGQD